MTCGQEEEGHFAVGPRYASYYMYGWKLQMVAMSFILGGQEYRFPPPPPPSVSLGLFGSIREVN